MTRRKWEKEKSFLLSAEITQARNVLEDSSFFCFLIKGRTPNLLCGEDQSRNEKSQFLQERMPSILCQYCPKECQTNAAMSSHVRHAHPLAKFKAVLKDSLTETPKYNSDTIVVDTEYSQEDLNEATSISNAGQEKKKENKKKEKKYSHHFFSS